ncbi:MAG: hypothetical protein ACQEQ4_00480 [Fibrobacterota bacterium]
MKLCNRRSFFKIMTMVLFFETVSVCAEDEIVVTDATIDSILSAKIDRLGHTADLNHINMCAVTKMDFLFYV